MIQPKPAVFMHIQKTAGTSLISMVRQIYGKGEVTSHGQFLSLSISELDRHKFVSGHFGFAVVDALQKERFSFTFLREPRVRILSQYYYMRTMVGSAYEIHKMAQRMSLDCFLEAAISGDPVIATHLFNQQTFQLAHGWICSGVEAPKKLDRDDTIMLALENLRSLNYVGLVETFDADCLHIFKALGVPEVRLEHRNKGPRCIRLSEISSRTRDQLNALTEFDDILYNSVKDARTGQVTATVEGCDDYRT